MSEALDKDIFQKIRLLEIRTRGLVNNIFSGEYHSAFKGRGMEFAEVREYQFGDDVRTIDWNVSARSDDVFIKMFEEEREQSMMILFDGSGSGVFGTANQFKRDLAAEICATLAFSAIKNNDKVGLMIFTDVVEKFIPPRKGRSHVLRILRDIFHFRPRGKQTNIGGAVDLAARVLKRRSIVFLVSDLMGYQFEHSFRVMSRKHDFIAIHVSDPREFELPRVGLLELEDAETGEHYLVDTYDEQFRGSYARRMEQFLDYRRAQLQRMKIDMVSVSTAESYIKPLTAFFRRREKRH
ncbi:protein of unknown function DUF58 [Chloroherpeton thalassium ATCC 35110]|uniref:VWFA domain-containing protein n=1 Tax=Chloroherpeton thalassium (strain ATCC 35110 / GB-78) TaxID=517418 RepID=B3QUH7_CHLT3|nr:DUF58 domain-containing protein [Chloroherpeton thalassium]ACF12883.1 protein of unknown function DUF58 [Chloroherpeton thalassium ATCC 35110]